jgi:C_GCAxxG_C_C family probable redox protein
MNKSEIALKNFNESFSCSQAVLSTFAGDFGVDIKTANKIASVFGGGIARNGETCGAVTGALMVLGLKYWDSTLNPAEAKSNVYTISNKFINEFKAKYNSIKCKELLDADLSTEDGRAKMKDENLSEKVCTKAVCDAVAILEKYI